MIDLSLEDSVAFADNPEPRCACVLLLDTSESMAMPKAEIEDTDEYLGIIDGVPTYSRKDLSGLLVPIEELNGGIDAYKEAVEEDSVASLRVETAIVTFDSKTKVVQDFATVDEMKPGEIGASAGQTSMAKGIDVALDLLDNRKQTYREAGIAYYRPWVILITDGASTDSEAEMSAAADRIKAGEEGKSFAFFAVGVEGADMDELNRLAPRGAMPLDGYAFREFFSWLSASMSIVSSSRIDDEINLPSPSGWAKL